MDVGTSFIEFLLQHDIAEVATNIQKRNDFLRFFRFLVLGLLEEFMINCACFSILLDPINENETKCKSNKG